MSIHNDESTNNTMTLTAYEGLTPYYGDIHNHCNLSYGKGTLEEALTNARLQLDFTSVTIHGHWPDIPTNDPRLGYLVDYHEKGFQRAVDSWAYYQDVIENANQPGEFITFPSFEWHSMAYGDHCIYFKDIEVSAIFDVDTLEQLRDQLRALRAQGHETFLIPHHIGYLQGYRGINWAAFTSEFSPVVEIFSFHGLAESSDAPLPYLHSMGPRDERSTMQYALRQGHLFGVIASTDHHSAHPGTYGYGRAVVWAKDLSRDSLWEAIASRRTYGISGERIALEFALNEYPMGSIVPASVERYLEVAVAAGHAIDYVEVLHNNRVIHRENVFESDITYNDQIKVCLEMGWGEEDSFTAWHVDLEIKQGALEKVEPRLRGHDIQVKLAQDDSCVFSHWQHDGNRVQLHTRTWPNPTVSSSATQMICLELSGNPNTRLCGRINDKVVDLPLSELSTGSRTDYLSGFVSPAYCLHRAIPAAEYKCRFAITHHSSTPSRDWYMVRVRQKNGQYAWSSPIWVEV